MKRIVLFFLAAVIIRPVFAQVTQEWVQRYNGSANSYDIVNKLLLDQNANVYVYGTTNEVNHSTDLTILKYNSGGIFQWRYSYNGSSNSFDQLTYAIQDEQGNSYITGTAIENDTVQIVLLKVSSGGNLVWNKSFKGHNTSGVSGRSISLFNNNTLALFWSELDVISNKYKARISYFTTTGQNISEILMDDAIINTAGSVKILYDDAGQTLAALNILDTITGLAKPTVYNATQNWYRSITGSANVSHSLVDMAIDNNNNVIALAMLVNNGTSQDFRTVKFSQNGTVLWQRDFNGNQNGDDYPYAVITDAQNNIYVTGLSRAVGVGTEDAVTIKYDANGNVKWTKLYNGIGSGTDQGISLCVDNNMNVYVGGATDLGGIKLGFLTIKYDSLGNQLWTKTYNFSSSSPEDFVYSIAVNSIHDVYITGISFSNANDYDFATIKYSQTIGIQKISDEIPQSFSLFQNYPNPFNPGTKISFQVPINKGGYRGLSVILIIYDVLGKEVSTLVNEMLQPGTYQVKWDGTGFPSGIYYYTLIVDDNNKVFRETKKLVLVK